MKKLVPFMIIVLLLFTASCKDMTVDFNWERIAFEGKYTEGVGSEIKVEGWAEILQPNIAELPIVMNIYDWRITLLQGDIVVLTLLKNDVYNTLGTVLINESELQTDLVWVLVASDTPIAGDIFQGFTPDKMIVEFKVRDFDGNLYEYAGEIDSSNSEFFKFERN